MTGLCVLACTMHFTNKQATWILAALTVLALSTIFTLVNLGLILTMQVSGTRRAIHLSGWLYYAAPWLVAFLRFPVPSLPFLNPRVGLFYLISVPVAVLVHFLVLRAARRRQGPKHPPIGEPSNGLTRRKGSESATTNPTTTGKDGRHHPSPGMNIKVTSVDHAPDELHAQTPFIARVLRQIPGPDRPDYLLTELAQPLTWRRAATTVSVRYLVLCARWVGGVIVPGTVHLPVNIAYVVDSSVLDDDTLDFSKCHYSAIGTADVTAS